MSLLQSSVLALALAFSSGAMACDCGEGACKKDKGGKMACEGKDKKSCSCGEGGEKGKSCECKDHAKKPT